jgi:superfamily II DNA or RNA helicase
MIGLTATPFRKDGKPLGDIFDVMVEGERAETLIEQGWLAPYDYYAPPSKDMEWKMRGIDYDLNDVTASLLKSKIYGDVQKYLDPARKTIIYSPSIEFSEHIPGVVHFDGNTPKKRRKQIIDDFRSGKIRALSNVDLIGEGFDVPDCDTVILLRPTMSTGLFIQQSMRALRPSPGKRATIYDLVGNVHRHGMPTQDRDVGLDKSIKPRNPTGEKDILVRRCDKCQLIYEGTERLCPYCGHDNGKTRQQIEVEKEVELRRIEKVKKRKKRMEVGRARTYKELVAIGKKRGYKNPSYWAKMILNGRKKRI